MVLLAMCDVLCLLAVVCLAALAYYFSVSYRRGAAAVAKEYALVAVQPSAPKQQQAPGAAIPTSVNYHFTRQCNYKCGFCFHTQITKSNLPLEESLRGLKLLRDCGMEKVNFSGGEPFLVDRGRYVGEMAKYCKQVLALPSVTIVSNGSLITEKHLKEYGAYIDILAISCDSFNEDTNRQIGRSKSRHNHVEHVRKIARWCLQYNVLFKINTVVNTFNHTEDMTEHILSLAPRRWKVFQCLPVTGENAGAGALRDVSGFAITDEQFDQFVARHHRCAMLVKESNEMMRSSYYILDEFMRFLDCSGGAKVPSRSILDVGVSVAMDQSGFDEAMFKKRGGVYKWSKQDQQLDW